MDYKMFFNTIVILFLFRMVSTEDIIGDVKLTKPICDIPVKTEEENEKFELFAIKEECMFQIFMDYLQGLDCLIQNGDNCDEDCVEKKSEIRDEVYELRVKDDVICKCKNPRYPSEEFSRFSIFDFQKEEIDNRIETLQEYIDCWNNLWAEMNKTVVEKYNSVKSGLSPEIIEKCDNQTKIHSEMERCNLEY